MKIDFFTNNAIKQGEEGNIEEMYKINEEVDKMRLKKKDFENILEGGIDASAFNKNEIEVENP